MYRFNSSFIPLSLFPVKLTADGMLNRHGFSVASLDNAMHCHEDRLKQVYVVVANNLPQPLLLRLDSLLYCCSDVQL
jgi:hypothetical protein